MEAATVAMPDVDQVQQPGDEPQDRITPGGPSTPNPAPNPAPAPAPPSPAPPPAPAPSQEVDYAQAKAEDTAEPAPQEKPKEDVLDLLKPKKEPRTWEIGPQDIRRSYIQRPLSFIGKMQWFSLVGEVLDKALSGDNAMSLNSLFSAPSGGVEAFRDADMFVQAVGKLLSVAPDFLVDSFCIWLAVPDYERDLASSLMKLPSEEGGLTDEQGMDIISTFIDQNYEALDSFFRHEIRGLRDRIQARAKEAAEKQQQNVQRSPRSRR